MNQNRFRFRAWDKKGKRMLPPECTDKRGDYGSHDEIYAGIWEIFQDGLGSVLFDDNLVLMQSTGLLDKNGKEIFEGDVVTQAGVVYEVRWDASEAVIKLFAKIQKPAISAGEEYSNPLIVLRIFDDSEVIGNIYHNPELT